MLEKAVTTITASVMTTAVLRFDVTANAEQTPKICNAIGLFETIGLTIISLVSDIA